MKTVVCVLLVISFFVIESCNQSVKEAVKFYEIGNSEMKSGNLINSIIYYSKAIALDSTKVDYFMARGNARLTAVDYEGATKDFTKVIQLDPNKAVAYLLRGMIKIYKKEFTDEAASDFNKAIEIDPSLAKAYYNLGVIKFVSNDPDAACAYWKKAAEMGFEQAIINLKTHCTRN